MNEFANLLFNDRDNPRNYTEDYPHENGNYSIVCLECGEYFLGHKRRYLCKLCANEPAEKLDTLPEEELDQIFRQGIHKTYGIWLGSDHTITNVKSEGFSKLEKEIAEKQQAQSTAHFLRT